MEFKPKQAAGETKPRELFPPDPTLQYADLDNAYTDYTNAQNDAEEQTALAKLDRIEMSLKKEGAIPTTEEEMLQFELDSSFPKAKSKEIVEFQGKQYRLAFIPKAKDERGKVIWGRKWETLDEALQTFIKKEYEPSELFAPDSLVTTRDLEEKESELDEAEGGYSQYRNRILGNDRGNNPGISRGREARIKRIEAEVSRIEMSLKKRGLLPTTEKELLEFKLDKLAGSKAKHDDVVELDGKKYKLRFKPIGKSRSGITVRVWGRAWQRVKSL